MDITPLLDFKVNESVYAPRETWVIDEPHRTITIHPLDLIAVVHRPAPERLTHTIDWLLRQAHHRFDARIAALAASPQPTNGHTS